ncbi:hypothetical protein ABN028_23330 [Actinopolymorpha sp. B17G11]|uniref:hypothetical protein n=1 Tax=Actinopolymorpha sp. B17G11 TaxID=3160861 RepID=UPI0032E483D4
MVRRIVLGALILVVASAPLTGCANTPITPGSSKSEKTPKATSTPSSPAPSADATSEGAEIEAVRHYNDVFNRAFATLDPDPLLAAASPDCTSCQGTADVITKLDKAGGRYDGFEQKIDKIALMSKGDRPIVQAESSLSAFDLVPRAGAKPEPQKARRLFLTFELEKRGDSWTVAQITQG